MLTPTSDSMGKWFDRPYTHKNQELKGNSVTPTPQAMDWEAGHGIA